MKTETELAGKVVSTLHEWGWEVYQEVIESGGRCDIVAKRGPILWAIECKLSFGLPVIDQAYRWRRRANYISVAVKSASGSGIGVKFCQDYRIGVLACRHNVYEVVKPKLARKINPIAVNDDQKTWGTAGTNGGDYYTPFKKTVRDLVKVVRANPGVEFNKLIKELDHHYRSLSTAKSCLRGFIGTAVIPEIEARVVDKRLCCFVRDKTETPP